MDLIDFGVLPYQLFNRNFPTRIYKNKFNTKKDMLNELRKLNLNLFNEEHIGEIYSPLESFICKGRTLINNNYIKIIDPKEHLNILENFGVNNNYLTKIENSLNKIIFYKSFGNINLKKTEFYDSSIIDYYFVGDIFGTVFIYSLVEYKESKDKEKEKEKNEKEDDVNKLFSLDSFEIINNGNKESLVYMESDQSKNKKEFYNLKGKENIIPITKVNKIVFTFQLKLIKKLNDHFKEIKFIDFNPRLNVFLSYSLDNFINIYIFPKLKLINAINTNLFKKDDINPFDEVVLVSYPFPLIVCHNKKYIYLLSINGELIKKKELEINKKILYIIDKNLGLFHDKVEIVDSEGNLKSIFNDIKDDKDEEIDPEGNVKPSSNDNKDKILSTSEDKVKDKSNNKNNK